MSINLDKLTADVAAVQGTVNSALTFISGLKAQIAAIPLSTDPATQASLDQLAAGLETSQADLANAIAANPAAAPPAPPAP